MFVEPQYSHGPANNAQLDMNGIIHNCTHNDSDGATARKSEDKMFIDIFNYIEHLFGKIKPKQLFFMEPAACAPLPNRSRH
jgi:5'-3' exoribonuclease 1